MVDRVIRVLIVDDHPQVRRGLRLFLELWEDFILAGEAENGEEAVKLMDQLQPDVVLLDLIMPVMDGVTTTKAIRQKFPHTQVIILTSTVDFDLISQALDAGAFSYMLKNVTIDEMADTIRAAVR